MLCYNNIHILCPKVLYTKVLHILRIKYKVFTTLYVILYTQSVTSMSVNFAVQIPCCIMMHQLRHSLFDRKTLFSTEDVRIRTLLLIEPV